MSVKDSLAALKVATEKGVRPTIEALDDFIDDVEDFLTFVEDYDEWESMDEKITYDADGVPERIIEPGFPVSKLRTALGYDKEGY